MPARLHLREDLSPEELFTRYQAARDPIGRTHFQVLHLVAQRWRTEEIAAAVGYSVVWIRLLVKRYNQGGAAAMGDQRRHNPGQKRLLPESDEQALKSALQSRTPEAEFWNGPRVAQWMQERLRRPVHPQRGWEVLRRLGYTPQRPRPAHEGGNPEAQESFPAESAADPGG